MTRRRLLTHMDLDGATCAILFLLIEPDAHVEFHDYNTINSAVRKHLRGGDPVLLADISPDEETLRWAAEKWPASLAIYDHHASGAWGKIHDDLPRVSGAFDSNGSGADLMHTLLEPQLARVLDGHQVAAIDWLLEATRARDLWQRDAEAWEDGCLLTQLVKYMGVARFVDWAVVRLRRCELLLSPSLLQILKAREERDAETARDIATHAFRAMDDEGRTYYWVIASRMASEIGHAIGEMYEDAEYAAIMLPVYRSVELRSKGKVHCGDLGRSRGGGGHADAGGYTMDLDAMPAEMARFIEQRTGL